MNRDRKSFIFYPLECADRVVSARGREGGREGGGGENSRLEFQDLRSVIHIPFRIEHHDGGCLGLDDVFLESLITIEGGRNVVVSMIPICRCRSDFPCPHVERQNKTNLVDGILSSDMLRCVLGFYGSWDEVRISTSSKADGGEGSR